MNLKALTEQKVEKQNEMEKLLDTDKTEKRGTVPPSAQCAAAKADR